MKKLLTYDDQLEFEKWAKAKPGIKDFYFDYTQCVDASTDRDIRGVTCDGTMTWAEALDMLKIYFS